MGPALEMLAAKVASVSGDARRALEIGRRSLEVGARKRPFAPTDDNKTVSSPKMSRDQGPVGLIQVKRVLDSVYGGSQQSMDSEEEEFPLQQKILVCCMLLLKRQPAKKNTIGKVNGITVEIKYLLLVTN
jgi:cell division control protein 6